VKQDLVSFSDWKIWRTHYNCLPIVRVVPKMPYIRDWRLFNSGPVQALLESMGLGRYSIYCPQVSEWIEGDSKSLQWWHLNPLTHIPEFTKMQKGNPIILMNNWIATFIAPILEGMPEFFGGWISAFSYDCFRTFIKAPCLARNDLELPYLVALFAKKGIVYDHHTESLYLFFWHFLKGKPDSSLSNAWIRGIQVLDSLQDSWECACAASEFSSLLTTPGAPNSEITYSLSRDRFLNQVGKIKNGIASGETYQVNLSLRQSHLIQEDPASIYESMRKINPSPYMGKLNLPQWTLLSGSPELLFQKKGNHIRVRPIAGTRPRGRCSKSDHLFAQELRWHPKEQAEHLMLVDLMRNDLGRVCEWGSITVSEFMALEGYSHVMHLVSQIEGVLSPNRSFLELFQSIFPGGTITGAPKIRTVTLIETLEPVRRHFYTGSLGWIGFNGDTALNILIRSLTIKDQIAHLQMGAGIVADSDPLFEWEECLAKGAALRAALQSPQLSELSLSKMKATAIG